MSEIVKRTSFGAPLPQDINVTGERAGAGHRRAAIAHVEAQLRDGFLDGDEAGRRVAFIDKATTRAEIRAVLEDLQPMPVPRWTSLDWSRPFVYVPFWLTMITIFIVAGTVGGLVISDAEPDPSLGAYLLGIPLLVTGVIGCIGSITGLAVKAEDSR